MASPENNRVIVAKPYCYDSSNPTIVAAALSEAGFEVTYLDLEQDFRTRAAALPASEWISNGLRHTCEAIANAALKESADAVWVSCFYDQMSIFNWILDLTKEKGMKGVLFLGGGPFEPRPEEVEELSQRGLGRLFGPGNTTHDIVKYLRDELPRRRKNDGIALEGGGD